MGSRWFLVVWLVMVGCGSGRGEDLPDTALPVATETRAVATATLLPTEEVAMVAVTLEPGQVYQQMVMEDGVVLDYGLIVPEGFVVGEVYPVLLALPPGSQTRSLVGIGLDSYWRWEPPGRGWVVISPAAPDGELFFQGSERYMPEFLARMTGLFEPEGGKVHVAGISNGGLSAFTIATTFPEWVHSVVVLPGYARPGEPFDNLHRLKDIPVHMFVGAEDTPWVSQAQATADRLTELGGTVSLEFVPDEGHVIQSLTGEQLYELLDLLRD